MATGSCLHAKTQAYHLQIIGNIQQRPLAARRQETVQLPLNAPAVHAVVMVVKIDTRHDVRVLHEDVCERILLKHANFISCQLRPQHLCTQESHQHVHSSNRFAALRLLGYMIMCLLLDMAVTCWRPLNMSRVCICKELNVSRPD